MMVSEDRARAACSILNDVIGVDNDPLTLALLLAWIGARTVQVVGGADDVRSYVIELRAFANRLERESNR